MSAHVHCCNRFMVSLIVSASASAFQRSNASATIFRCRRPLHSLFSNCQFLRKNRSRLFLSRSRVATEFSGRRALAGIILQFEDASSYRFHLNCRRPISARIAPLDASLCRHCRRGHPSFGHIRYRMSTYRPFRIERAPQPKRTHQFIAAFVNDIVAQCVADASISSLRFPFPMTSGETRNKLENIPPSLCIASMLQRWGHAARAV